MSDEPLGPVHGIEARITRLSTITGGKPVRTVDNELREASRAGQSAVSGRAGQPHESPGDAAQEAEEPAGDLGDLGDGDGSDLVQQVLHAAKGMAGRAAGRPARRRGPLATGSSRRGAWADAGGGYSGARPDSLDPAPARDVLAGLFAARGWERPLQEARVFADWPALVGREIAAHCQPVSLSGGELRLSAQSTAWATQLRLLAGSLLARLVAELGPTVVTRLHITGPVAPSWSHGPRSVRGARGPRDTYG